jgi:hypothetical protein
MSRVFPHLYIWEKFPPREGEGGGRGEGEFDISKADPL